MGIAILVTCVVAGLLWLFGGYIGRLLSRVYWEPPPLGAWTLGVYWPPLAEYRFEVRTDRVGVGRVHVEGHSIAVCTAAARAARQVLEEAKET